MNYLCSLVVALLASCGSLGFANGPGAIGQQTTLSLSADPLAELSACIELAQGFAELWNAAHPQPSPGELMVSQLAAGVVLRLQDARTEYTDGHAGPAGLDWRFPATVALDTVRLIGHHKALEGSPLVLELATTARAMAALLGLDPSRGLGQALETDLAGLPEQQ